MRSKQIADGPERTYALVFDEGDEVMAELQAFARASGLTAARFDGIGAFRDVTLGYFDWETKQYQRNRFDEQVEVVSLTGDVAVADAGPAVHAHVALGRADATALGGHLLEGHVRPTLELVLVESPAHLRKRYDETSGLALIDPAL